MANKNNLKQVLEIVAKDLELETTPDTDNEQAMLDMLARRVADLMEYRMEFLMSMMYRLDVPEYKVAMALRPDAEDLPSLGLAKLIWERQKQRLETRQTYQQPKMDDDDWSF